MYLLLKNLNPECHSLIKQHKSIHGFSNLDKTVESLVWMAAIDYPNEIEKLENKILKLEQKIQRLQNE